VFLIEQCKKGGDRWWFVSRLVRFEPTLDHGDEFRHVFITRRNVSR
jgi:hypothetical protein